MNRGDVVRVDLPQPTGKPGREQFGERPAVIIQVGKATANLATVVVVPFTSNKKSLNFFGSVLVAATALNGLDCDSIALIQQLRTIDKNRIRRTVGKLSADDLSKIEAVVRELLRL